MGRSVQDLTISQGLNGDSCHRFFSPAVVPTTNAGIIVHHPVKGVMNKGWKGGFRVLSRENRLKELKSYILSGRFRIIMYACDLYPKSMLD